MGSLVKMKYLYLFLILLFIGIDNIYTQKIPKNITEASNVILIKGGSITMGNEDIPDAQPTFKVKVKPFFAQQYEVTNAQFQEFVNATHYPTLAERSGGSYVFRPENSDTINAIQDSPWWIFELGANWKHPSGRNTDLAGKEWHPVVHIAYEDAYAYCEWLNMRLPTEVEREYITQKNGTSKDINIWQGKFPIQNTLEDGYYRTSPVGSFPAGQLGLYDVQGNVWEWCLDPYHQNAYHYASDTKINSNQPLVPKYYDLDSPDEETRVIRGGSFLCNDSYCCGYLPNRRMRASIKMTFEHIGFRCVRDR